MKKSIVALAIAVAISACARAETGTDTTAAATTADPVVTAAATAKAIEANPAATDSILTAAGYTRESFQQLMYDIAADSAKAAAYAAAKVP
jgi:5,10-methylene-tetrahydrofolate dehydrogenase/methenyl tetrahydrofolate cyclohydrolase